MIGDHETSCFFDKVCHVVELFLDFGVSRLSDLATLSWLSILCRRAGKRFIQVKDTISEGMVDIQLGAELIKTMSCSSEEARCLNYCHRSFFGSLRNEVDRLTLELIFMQTSGRCEFSIRKDQVSGNLL